MGRWVDRWVDGWTDRLPVHQARAELHHPSLESTLVEIELFLDPSNVILNNVVNESVP